MKAGSICGGNKQLKLIVAFSFFIVCLFKSVCINAQANDSLTHTKPKFEWNVGFNTFFDNREGEDTHLKNRTFFLTRLSPEVGLSMADGKHRIMGGVSWTQPIGSDWDGYKINPVLYYRYDNGSLDFSLGFAPRNGLHQRLPNYLESDSTSYFQYTFRGGFVNYSSDKGYFEGILDWRGMQAENRREAFCLIAGGEWNLMGKFLKVGGFGIMNHLARTSSPTEDEHVIDNIILNPYIGTDISSLTPFKQFEIKLGLLSSLNRNRGEGSWVNAAGFYSDINIEWWRLTLNNTLYVSKYPLFRFYREFGSLLYDGEPYYASSLYDRLSLQGLLVGWKNIVDLRAALDFNFTKEGLTFCQKLTLSVNF